MWAHVYSKLIAPAFVASALYLAGQATIAADRLLTFDLRDGWKPLCEFLEVEVPSGPFPKTNSSKEFVNEEWKQ